MQMTKFIQFALMRVVKIDCYIKNADAVTDYIFSLLFKCKLNYPSQDYDIFKENKNLQKTLLSVQSLHEKQ